MVNREENVNYIPNTIVYSSYLAFEPKKIGLQSLSWRNQVHFKPFIYAKCY
jgi:hypothetical protein